MYVEGRNESVKVRDKTPHVMSLDNSYDRKNICVDNTSQAK